MEAAQKTYGGRTFSTYDLIYIIVGLDDTLKSSSCWSTLTMYLAKLFSSRTANLNSKTRIFCVAQTLSSKNGKCSTRA